MNFSDLGLSPSLVQAINQANYEAPYPIQVEAIPAILQKRDLLGLAQTGSGKTASYILPILEDLQGIENHRTRSIPILVIVPTRELAAQVEEVVRFFGKHLPRKVKSMAVFGGVSINPQMMNLNGTDILVATPGRLLDLLAKNAITLDRLRTLVLDEADKVLSLGFKLELDEILARLPKKRQNILFSATMDETVEGLIGKLLKNPLKIEIQAEEVTPDLINQTAYLITQEKKGPLLRHLISEGNWQQVLVFASSIRTADNLTTKLNKHGIQAMAFHGDKSQGARMEALKQFKGGKVRVLVATDLAARGIDIQALPYVVNFELPRSPKDYIHRIGRTGRAGMQGEAISLITEEDQHHWKVIQKKMKRWVEMVDALNIDF
ncbi:MULTISPECIES: DEAD/DEAH box helicase [Mongoliitalea]|uniref:ATP-dependent RNA helicase RhlE n=1 Tax=Mongoliitalea lutea TaxID=849756 RepID=A0A8J3CUC4_9BACT|nr:MULTISPECIES: DEAD/DEAH box helicase [Mongoliitalea]UJP66351.1 DEAD/DEAH box helicase [Mongoliitalea daihaiensis]GHB30146.1 ATP-dependent RNA helicase RhlE [Mongoliitalea lutea]